MPSLRQRIVLACASAQAALVSLFEKHRLQDRIAARQNAVQYQHFDFEGEGEWQIQFKDSQQEVQKSTLSLEKILSEMADEADLLAIAIGYPVVGKDKDFEQSAQDKALIQQKIQMSVQRLRNLYAVAYTSVLNFIRNDQEEGAKPKDLAPIMRDFAELIDDHFAATKRFMMITAMFIK